MALTTIVAAVCGLWLMQAQRQRDASILLVDMGAKLEMEEPATWFRWLPKSMLSYDGGHYFCPVTDASLSSDGIKLEHPPFVPLLAKLPCLKSLQFDRESLGKESIAGLSGCHRLESLDLRFGKFDDECLSQLPRMPRLKSLDLSYNSKCSIPKLQFPQLQKLSLGHTKANNETLLQVGKLTQLRELELYSTRVTDVGIVHLKDLQRLEHIDLDSTSTTGAKISDLRSLKSLSLGDTLLEDRYLGEICTMPNLEELDVHNCRNITDASLSRIGNSKKLRRLDASDCRRISQASVKTIAKIATLDYLCLEGTGITSIDSLQPLSKLYYLTNASDQFDLEVLLGFPNLRSFVNYDPRDYPSGWTPNNNYHCDFSTMFADLAGRSTTKNAHSGIVLVGITGLRAKHFLSFDPNVEYLSLAHSRFDSEALSVVSSWPTLECLCLLGSSVTNEDLREIPKLQNLHTLQLDRTEIDDQGIAELVGLESLRELSLTDTRVTQVSMPAISSLTKLDRLSLPFVPTTESLLKLLNSCPLLTEFRCYKSDVDGTDLPDIELDEEAEFSLGKEGELNLGQVRMSSSQFEKLLSWGNFKSLKTSTLTDDLCEVLVRTTQIDSLDLAGSPVSDAGLRVLLKNKELRSLNLANTKVTPEGIRSLSKSPNLVDTLIYDSTEDVDVLIEAVQGLKMLTNLYFPISRLSRDDASKFLACCNELAKERPLKLFDTEFNFDAVKQLPSSWMVGESGFDAESSHIILLGPLIDNEKLREFEPSGNLEVASAANVACAPDLLIDKLTQCPNLRFLTLNRIPLSSELIAQLKNLKRLHKLKLTECGIDDSHLPKLAELTQVVELTLDSNEIQGEQLGSFSDSTQLDLLSLRMNPLSANGRRIAEQFENQSRWRKVIYPSLIP